MFYCFNVCFKVDVVLYLDVKFEVLVHGVDVVKDVVGDARDDSHQLGVVQFALNTATENGCFDAECKNFQRYQTFQHQGDSPFHVMLQL